MSLKRGRIIKFIGFIASFLSVTCLYCGSAYAAARAQEVPASLNGRFSAGVIDKQIQKQNELADKIKEKLDRLIAMIEKNLGRLELLGQRQSVIQANMSNRDSVKSSMSKGMDR